jgi:hypothetical protein
MYHVQLHILCTPMLLVGVDHQEINVNHYSLLLFLLFSVLLFSFLLHLYVKIVHVSISPPFYFCSISHFFRVFLLSTSISLMTNAVRPPMAA